MLNKYKLVFHPLYLLKREYSLLNDFRYILDNNNDTDICIILLFDDKTEVTKNIFKAYKHEDLDLIFIDYLNHILYPNKYKSKKNPYKTYNKKMRILHPKIINIIEKNFAKLNPLYPNKNIAYVLFPMNLPQITSFE